MTDISKKVSVLFVCLGNICRSPTAHGVFRNLVIQAGLEDKVEIDSAGNIIESEKDFSGNIVPSVPKNNLFLSLSYAHSIFKNITGFAKFSFLGISGLWVDDANTDKTKSYQLLNSVLGLDMKFGKLNIMMSGGMNNMLDEVYVGFTNTNSSDKRYYEAGEPRNYFLSLNVGYRF